MAIQNNSDPARRMQEIRRQGDDSNQFDDTDRMRNLAEEPGTQPVSHIAPRCTAVDSYGSPRLELEEITPQRGSAPTSNESQPLPSLHPPVTKQSLSELNIIRIINNIKLRHDINFDRELHFRPNLDGERGQRKKKEAEAYWEALVDEFAVHLFIARDLTGSSNLCLNSSSFVQVSPSKEKDEPKRIPLMFEAIRDILKTLVPERDHVVVDQRLDIVMLMQEIRHGLCDFVRLSQWLAQLLKAHCAPMRDEWVDIMVKHFEFGVQHSERGSLVDGLKTLFGILEAMKLHQDVANHQIRSLRLLLIEDTVNFEQKYFLRKIAKNAISVEASRSWYKVSADPEYSTAIRDEQASRKNLDIFVEALLSKLCDSTISTDFSQIFSIDLDRLRYLRIDIRNAINLEITYGLFVHLTNLLGRAFSKSQARSILREHILSIVEGSDGRHRWTQYQSSVALEVVRIAHHVCGHMRLRGDYVSYGEAWFTEHLDPASSFHAMPKREVEKELRLLVGKFVETYSEKSPLAIFHLAVPEKGAAGPRYGNLEEIAKRIAHISLLHWRVWSPLLYLRPLPDDTSALLDGSAE
ncbi:MAG: hypothetical protein M1827_002898 [Pycnora praestabilis]|nr:MAG: hypothetical protein M1827_002898 [Pycnora praestabilis]